MSYAGTKEEILVSQFLDTLQISNEQDYENRLDYVESLMDRANAGDDLVRPLLDYVSRLIERYEEEEYSVSPSSPGRMLAFYMNQHNHKQKDLSDIATQSVISEILNEKRMPTPEQVKKLAKKYHTNPALFL